DFSVGSWFPARGHNERRAATPGSARRLAFSDLEIKHTAGARAIDGRIDAVRSRSLQTNVEAFAMLTWAQGDRLRSIGRRRARIIGRHESPAPQLGIFRSFGHCSDCR